MASRDMNEHSWRSSKPSAGSFDPTQQQQQQQQPPPHESAPPQQAPHASHTHNTNVCSQCSQCLQCAQAQAQAQVLRNVKHQAQEPLHLIVTKAFHPMRVVLPEHSVLVQFVLPPLNAPPSLLWPSPEVKQRFLEMLNHRPPNYHFQTYYVRPRNNASSQNGVGQEPHSGGTNQEEPNHDADGTNNDDQHSTGNPPLAKKQKTTGTATTTDELVADDVAPTSSLHPNPHVDELWEYVDLHSPLSTTEYQDLESLLRYYFPDSAPRLTSLLEAIAQKLSQMLSVAQIVRDMALEHRFFEFGRVLAIFVLHLTKKRREIQEAALDAATASPTAATTSTSSTTGSKEPMMGMATEPMTDNETNNGSAMATPQRFGEHNPNLFEEGFFARDEVATPQRADHDHQHNDNDNFAHATAVNVSEETKDLEEADEDLSLQPLEDMQRTPFAASDGGSNNHNVLSQPTQVDAPGPMAVATDNTEAAAEQDLGASGLGPAAYLSDEQLPTHNDTDKSNE